MKIEDIDKEMKEVKASTAAAHSAFQEEDFVTAAKLYSSVAAQLQRVYSADHPDALRFFLLAGDSYFYLDRFSEAADTYLQLQSVVDSHPGASVDRSVLCFKTAKALEKAKRFDEAEKAYGKALDVCNKNLSENHPLLTIVNESFAGFIRHIRKNPQASIAFEERAEDLRERNKNIHGLYENYLEPLKRRAETIRSDNLHARADGRRDCQNPPQQVVFNRRRSEDKDKSTTVKTLKIAAASLIVFVVISIATGLGLRKVSEQQVAEPEEKPVVSSEYRKNLISNGGFEAERGCENTPEHPVFLIGWKKLCDPVRQTRSVSAIGPSDGIQFVNLGWTGEISHVFYTRLGRSYTLLIDVATPAPDENPVVFYSFDAKNWLPINVKVPNSWHTETIHFLGSGNEMVLTIKSGATTGTSERYVDNVRLYQEPGPLDGL